ncbi:hypothetical protein EC957_006599 [Mortierella hygrophila]|uniref:Protein Zds1 C-terminal domain-containing protein n=1 Tax=Mortierella hygrophila TaxID=979708 RepID=A0A9P6K8S0_9FUNG|nr:hypothetical protein EC957_006599 [Mortierella hygrophila]
MDPDNCDSEPKASTSSTYPTASSAPSSSSSTTSTPETTQPQQPGSTDKQSQDGGQDTLTVNPTLLVRSGSQSNRHSIFVGEHITISQDGPIIEAPSSHSPGSNDDQEDMKEVQIETADPSHLFWVPFHLHPEIAPNEYNRWLSKHGVDSESADGMVSSRSPSITRRKSVLSAQYNPDEDTDDRPSKPPKIEEEEPEGEDFLSGVFSAPLEQMGEPPLRTKTSLRRSVSLSASSPTRSNFPSDAVEEDLITVKRPGGLERSALSLLRRSARTKIRRNSTASNDTRHDVSRLRQTVNANGEYPAVSLVDHGPLPRPSDSQDSTTIPTPTKDAETQPLKRFVSTLRDSSKPTITTYVEPHLLEQQRRDQKANGELNDGEEAPSFRISAPGKLENTALAQLAETLEKSRKEKLDNFTINYPIPPPVKLAHNLLQQPSSQDPSAPNKPSRPQQQYDLPGKNKQPGQGAAGIHTHQKKPSSWSWLWGKEKGEKGADGSTLGGAGSSPGGMKSAAATPSQTSSIETNTPTTSSAETTVKKPSTLSLLFSRNSKSTSAKAQATTAETTHSISMNGQSLTSDRPKYSNYNRLPIHIERAIYRLSHVKLANPRRPLHEQVLISNMMFWYLGVIQQQQLQQQADLQQQQAKDSTKGGESKEDKEGKKPKKKKSQKKKKNQQRGSGKSAERVVKGPEYEKQQQQNLQVQHSPRPRQQGSSMPSGGPAHQQQLQQQQQYGRSHQNGQGGHDEESRASGTDYSDSYEESDGDDYTSQAGQESIGSQSDTLTALSIQSARMTTEEEDEDDDVPLAHYQNMPSRQGVPVS